MTTSDPRWYTAPPLPPRAALHPSRYGDLTMTGKASAGGTVTLRFDQVPDAELWHVGRVVLQVDSGSAFAAVYDGDPTVPASLLDTTGATFTAAQAAIADNATDYRIRGARQFTVVLTGMTPGALATARIWFTVDSTAVAA